MGNATGSEEVPQWKEGKPVMASTGSRGPTKSPKLCMPPEEELEKRFTDVLNTMNLPADKVKLLSQYDSEKKWELICDQERFQVKNPPSAYLEKLRNVLDHSSGRKFKRRVQESTQVLRELEISLRTNHIGWAQEFLNNENRGLDVLVDYLSAAHSSVSLDVEGVDSSTPPPPDRHRTLEKSPEELNRSASNSPRTAKAKTHTVRKPLWSSRVVAPTDDVHLCIMCLRAIMNYQTGFNLVMEHPSCVNEITLSLNNRNPRTKALVLELLAAVCLVRGGHDIILSAFDNFKEVCGEKNRFEKLMEFFCKEDKNMDFMVACMQFINIVVHSVENMNFRVHLQYEFSRQGLDEYLETLRLTESDRLLVQIQAYLDNMFDVGALLEDAETKNALLEHVEELQEHNTQLNSRLQESERETIEKVSGLEKKLIQTSKEVELLKESLQESSSQVTQLQQRDRERELQREGERERQREQERVTHHLMALQSRVSHLVEQGLLRMEQSPSGLVDLQVVPVVQQGPPKVGDEVDSADAHRDCAPPLETPPPLQSAPPPPPPPPPPPLPPPPLGSNKAAPPPAPPAAPPPPAPPPGPPGQQPGQAADGNAGLRKKKPIQTKYRMPLLNWQALRSHQVTGTVFHELDDEMILQELNMVTFEEQFKTKSQVTPVDMGTLKIKLVNKTPSRVSLMEPNRAKNLAITLRKEGMAASDICSAIETYNQKTLSLDFLELLERFIPTEYEMRLIGGYESEGRPVDELSEEDRFMVRFSKIARLPQHISTLTFMGNFPDSIQLIQPQLDAVIAASLSVKSSSKLKKILEVILAFGNYMNSSKRGSAYGFRLQSLDLLLDTKSTDRKETLMHFIVRVIQEKYPEVHSFYTELHFLDKAALVSLESIVQDLQALDRGMELTRREFSLDPENPVLKAFLDSNAELLDSLTADGKTAQAVYESAVEYFGESSKTTPPSMFFPMFVRFIKAYKQAERENEQRRKQSLLILDPPSSPQKEEVGGNKLSGTTRLQQVDLIAELKKKQVSPQMREGKDGTIEDIITDLRNQPYRRTDGGRRSGKWKPGQQLHVSSDISL